ncbi:hypothetical protein [Anaerophilus nitritogenes]|uniref:hypothetical protein n=1 Tax=Anaerophilus nitritogenes TaxID=2498136 RepID=UPI00101DEC9B|nr:hypothetical protein [Anaerophilus nitritogenes]
MKKQRRYIIAIFSAIMLLYIFTTLKHVDFLNNAKIIPTKEEKQDLTEESDFNLEMEVYELNKKNTLSDDEVELMINYLGEIDWKKYHELKEREFDKQIIEFGQIIDTGEFSEEAILRYDKYTSKEILYIYEAYTHSDGASAELFGSLLYELNKRYPDESSKLYNQHQGYKKIIDIIIENYEYNISL